MKDCIFCKFQSGEISVKKIFEDENFFAVNDINPKAPIHIICIVKKHISKVQIQNSKENGNYELFLSFAHKVAKNLGLDKKGYQLKMNYSGYNEIDHEHVHVLSGDKTIS